LPRWTPPSNASPELVAQWKQFLAALETHEIGHKDISGRAARDVLIGIRQLSAVCTSFPVDAKRVTDGIVARQRIEQTKYDADTRHGATQGATFPPRPVAGT
jgi:predicted secreted Zn-dependent protease